MLTISIMRLKHPTVEPKFKSSEPKEGAVMPLVRIDISKTASRQPEWLGLRCVNVLELKRPLRQAPATSDLLARCRLAGGGQKGPKHGRSIQSLCGRRVQLEGA
jgi:hypothetical protein